MKYMYNDIHMICVLCGWPLVGVESLIDWLICACVVACMVRYAYKCDIFMVCGLLWGMLYVGYLGWYQVLGVVVSNMLCKKEIYASRVI